VLQISLGWMAGSIALLADAAHSAADVVTYALNFLVEWLKNRAAFSDSERWRGLDDDGIVEKRIDTWGSLVSLLMLAVPTWLAVSEALDVLTLSPVKDDSQIGGALLVFAVVGTALNIAMLVAYRWVSEKESAGASSKGIGDVAGNLKGSIIGNKVDAPPQITMAKRPWQSFDDENETSAGDASDDDASASQESGDTSPKSDAGFTSTSRSNRADDKKAGGKSIFNFETLHMVVHPGCKCQHNFLTLDTEEGDKQDKRDEAVTSTSQNLNLAAVMLHLVTDVLRSILILVSAILILCGGVHDAERADAVCALIVAGLICAGSLGLLMRVFDRLCECFSRKDDAPPDEEAPDLDEFVFCQPCMQ
jgi:cation diffusion facilitator family transporter